MNGIPKYMPHAYVDRTSGNVRRERLIGDPFIHWLYGDLREYAPFLYRLLISPRFSKLLGMLHYDLGGSTAADRLARNLQIDLSECTDRSQALRSPRHLFERTIRYWDLRPLSTDPRIATSPADARVLTGSLHENRYLFLKHKFFSTHELVGPRWASCFEDGTFAVFRLTPDKYHYNHVPVNGRVIDIFELEGCCHACNPVSVLSVGTPYSRNRRTVTLFDTDIPSGSGMGRVAMVEVTALMIGSILQGYSAHRYESPQPLARGMMAQRGQPKSLYRPGSSVDVLLFEPGRVRICEDLVAIQERVDVPSRYSLGFGRTCVETDVRVRSPIARACT